MKSILNLFKSVFVLVVITASFSCAKKASKIRGTKTQRQILNTQTTNDSTQLAVIQNVNYMLNSISTPEESNDGSYTISSEISRQSQFIPFSTTHFGEESAYGIYDDASNGHKLDIRSRCLGIACEKYVLLLTVVKNGYAYHQIAAISFKDDDFFYVEERNHQRLQLFTSLDEVIQQHANLRSGQ